MTQEEIRATYTELADIVRAAGLAWILSQVEQTVHAGRAVEKPTRIFKEEDRDDGTPLFSDEQYGSRRGGKPTAMMALEPWPDRDQVLFLIDGLRHAIVHAAEIENDQIRLLRSFGDVEQVSFESDDESAEQEPLRLRGIHDERIQRLKELLRDLEREVRS